MKQLICEMCGSNDIIKQDELYICQACGTKYASENNKKDSTKQEDLIIPNSEGLPLDEIKKNNSNCYIATSIYGSYDCPEVWTLRRFRDYKLNKNIFGKIFIKFYYSTSPTLVKYLGNTFIFNKIIKKILDNFISKLQEKGYESNYYID